MKRLTFSLLILFLFLSTAYAQNATIAAWNIEGFTPLDDSKARRLGRVIGNLQPDVIVLTEVNPNSVVNEIRNELNGYHAAT
jgi:hypothetical protein